VPTLPALFAVMRRMSRVEANALLPRLAAFGAPAERWLIDGLRSKKAFMRQGCALALGRLATPLAVDALVRLLFEEPTEIWTEVARAVGDVGAPAVMPLAALLREVDGEVRERAVHALAHVAARTAEGGHPANRTAVETLASGRDALVANAARRALVLAPDVHNAHQAVRSERREQTLVRAFTRHFYDALDNDADFDLDSDQLEALSLQDEEDDADPLDETDLEPLIDDSHPGLPIARPQARRPQAR
jgi:HEAT repeat protein